MELLDEVQVRAINLANDKKFPEVPTLMFEFVGTGEVCKFDIKSPVFFIFMV